MTNGDGIVTSMIVLRYINWRGIGSQKIGSVRGYGVSQAEIAPGLQPAREQNP